MSKDITKCYGHPFCDYENCKRFCNDRIGNIWIFTEVPYNLNTGTCEFYERKEKINV